MHIMYDRELRLLGATGSIDGAKAVRVVDDEGKGRLMFELHVMVKGGSEWSKLVTSHNKPRLFPNLNFLYSLIAEACPSLVFIQVDIRQDA